ncbi:MAG: response regulator transcription factor [Phycisphaerae bacterium]|nr:response regulator transcription factor [Saprospiraceae bacterium]
MKKIRCFIVDDEPLAIKVIEQHLSKLSAFEVCGKSTNPVEALAQIKMLQPELVFMDIEMPEINGMELIATLQNKPAIIITTAYREYAVEGFELNALDYLVKPIPFARFLMAIEKFLEQHLPPVAAPIADNPACIFVKADRKTIRVLLGDILFVEGIKDYSRIVLAGQKIITKVSIGNFFKELPEERFIRVHKSFIVARNKITAFTAMDVEVNGVEIPIGRLYREAFFERMEGEKGLFL